VVKLERKKGEARNGFVRHEERISAKRTEREKTLLREEIARVASD
jgi:hypothetical protein